jgi:hypothetical protein
MSVKSTSAITSGTHPPAAILTALAPKKARSIERNPAVSSTTVVMDQPHRPRATTAKRILVTTIVPVTAMPYAAASAPAERKVTTSKRHPTMSAALISGT